MEVTAIHGPWFSPWIRVLFLWSYLWCHELDFTLDAMPTRTSSLAACLRHGNRHGETREPVCPVTHPPEHGTESRKGRWIESSPNPRLNELNKVTELDKVIPFTFGPAVSALDAITSWLCFCDPASVLWVKAGRQLPSPRAGRGWGILSPGQVVEKLI